MPGPNADLWRDAPAANSCFARTWHYKKMRPCIEQSKGPESLSPFRSWPDCIINTSGYDFRKEQRTVFAGLHHQYVRI
jgi:hypothetical protein